MKKLFVSLLTIILMVLTAALTVPVLVPVDEYKTAALQWLKEATGRDVTVEGGIRFSLLPNIALQLEEVTVSNPASSYTSPYLAKIGNLELSLQLMPLFSKQIEVDALTLEKPEIWLEETASGSRNWEFKSTASSAAQDNSVKSETGFHFGLNRLDVKQGSLHLLQKKEHLQAQNIKANWQDNQFSIGSDITLRGMPLNLNLQMQQALAFAAGENVPFELKLKGEAVQLALDGKVKAKINDVAHNLAAKGAVSLQVSSTAELAKSLKLDSDLPDSSLKLESSDVTFTPNQVALSLLEANWGNTQIRGNLNMNWGKSVPYLKGELNIPELVLADFQAHNSTSAAEDKANHGWDTAPIDLSGLQKFDADLNLTIGRLQSDRLQLHNLAAKAKNRDGRLGLNIANAELFGGTVTAKSSLNSLGIAPQWQLEGEVKHLAVEELAGFFTDKANLTGTLDGDFSLAAFGKSENEWMNQLGGGGKFAMQDGVIKGYSLPKLFRNLEVKSGSENTQYSRITVQFTADAGIMNLQEASLRAQALEADVTGAVNIGDRTLDLRLKPKVVPKFNVQNVEEGQSVSLMVPLKVTGSFDNVSVYPDVKAAMREALEDPEQAKHNIKALKHEGEALIKGLEDQKDSIKDSWKELKKGKSPESLGKLLNQLDQGGLPVPKILDGYKTGQDKAGPVGDGSGTGAEPIPGAGTDTGGENSGQQGTTPDEGGAPAAAGN